MELTLNEERRPQLEKKLEEYKSRLDNYAAPELQIRPLMSIAILSRLLEDGKVDTEELSRELADTYGSAYYPHGFNSSCGVIDDYNRTGGQNVVGGTGLPGV